MNLNLKIYRSKNLIARGWKGEEGVGGERERRERWGEEKVEKRKEGVEGYGVERERGGRL